MSTQAVAMTAEPDQALGVFLTERARLLRIAHRVLGEASAAEDVVQDAWIRWQGTDRRAVRNAAGFLGTTTTHLAINVLQSARHRHDVPAERLRSEPADTTQDAPSTAESEADVTTALALLAGSLTRQEIAVYVLRRAFDYSYPEIARLLRTSTANARQLAHRAQAALRGERPPRGDAGAPPRELVEAFLGAARAGRMGALEAVLTGQRMAG